MDLIGAVTEKLGIPSSTAQGAVGSILSAITQVAPPDAAAAIEANVPEASQWIASAPAPAADGGGLGGLGGGLGDLVGGLMGGGAGSLAGLAGTLSKLGIGADGLGQLVPLVLEFLKSRVGDGVVSKLLAAVPLLSQLAGGQSGGGSSLGSLVGGLGGLLK